MAMKDLAASALVAAVVAAGTTYVLDRSGWLRQAEDVPSVMGMTVESARAVVERHGLLLTVSQEREEPKSQPGLVVEQHPLEGSQVYRGESVTVVVARPPAKVKVPSLLGQTLAEARQHLEAIRLAVGRTSEDLNEKVPAGSVAAQSVAPGVEAEVGTTVDLVVSKGAETFPVPSVVGRSLNRAKDQLLKAGFTVGNIKYKTNEDQDEGVVLQQTPAANQPAAKGTAVELIVNRFD
jgi:beta-lactam-binding protein with PASTA domain